MKTCLPKWVLGWMALFMLAGHAISQTRIATVDLSKVLNGYHKTKEAEELLKTRSMDLEKTQRAMVEDYKKAGAEYKTLLDDANNQAVAIEERERCKKTAEAKLLQLKERESSLAQYDREAQVTLDEHKRRLTENLLRDIRAVIAAKAKAAHYGVVLDSSTQAGGATSLLYADGEHDLTEEVLNLLNKGDPAEGPAADRKKEK